MIDETHDQSAHCWVPGADSHADFPVQNLPLGIFSIDLEPARVGVAIGDYVLDLAGAATLLQGALSAAVLDAVRQPTLNCLFALAGEDRLALRLALFRMLTDDSRQAAATAFLHPATACRLRLPIAVRDYTDFYAGIHHAHTVGSLMRPDNPLLPNYKHIPVGYHGRASSIRESGGEVRRPRGQILMPGEQSPVFAKCARLDYEVELGMWIAGQSQLGEPVPIGEAGSHVGGFSLLNDWSARDIQTWEYQPLGPFLAKNFATTVSPWIVTAEALAPFRTAQEKRPEGDPAPLAYLWDEDDQSSGAFDINIDVTILTRGMKQKGMEPFRVGRTATRHLYWTPAQMIAHHTVNGCDLAAGDLLGSGTISGPDDASRGSLMELSRGGRQPIALPSGETRTFLEDGDEIMLSGWAERSGYRRIGFGSCSATITPALPL